MKPISLAVATASAILVLPTMAKAVTAEEAFAFIVFNVEHDTMRTFGKARVKIVKKSDSPLTFEISEDNRNSPVQWIVHPNKDCVFATEILLDSDHYYARFHMDKAWKVDWYASSDGQNTPKIRFGDECGMESVSSTGERVGCESSVSVGMIFKRDVRLERAKKAVNYFQEKFCAGAPY